jgi:hypothetical protein
VSKKAILRTLAIILFLGGVFLALSECRPGRPTRFNFWRVQTGMSQADVEALLGPGKGLHEGSGAGQSERLLVPGHSAADVDKVLRWLSDDFGSQYLLVGFKDGRVCCKFEGGLGSP